MLCYIYVIFFLIEWHSNLWWYIHIYLCGMHMYITYLADIVDILHLPAILSKTEFQSKHRHWFNYLSEKMLKVKVLV